MVITKDCVHPPDAAVNVTVDVPPAEPAGTDTNVEVPDAGLTVVVTPELLDTVHVPVALPVSVSVVPPHNVVTPPVEVIVGVGFDVAVAVFLQLWASVPVTIYVATAVFVDVSVADVPAEGDKEVVGDHE